MFSNAVVLVWDGVEPFELGVLCEMWGTDRSDEGLPVLDFAVCTSRPGKVRTPFGFDVEVEHGLDRVAEADLVCIAPVAGNPEPPPEIIEAVRAAADRGARILSVCTAAFVLGDAGLLDGRECTTHWRYTDELQARFPQARVVPEVLYVDDGPVITSAGSAAGIDASLHLWRVECGARAASVIARRMVVPPHRDGGQAQFIDAPVAACEDDLLGAVLAWADAHLADEISVEILARRALMSPRSFARRFKATTGTTPHAWLLGRRLAAAEELLENSDAPVEEIARLVGFGTAAGLREQFGRRRGVSPRAYRQTFRAGAGSGRGAVPVQLDGHRAGRVGGDQSLVEAEFGQPA
jgi:transcriptional regulator GlxA family with amidase domain